MQSFFVQAHVEHTPGGWGPLSVTRDEPVFVGVTLRTRQGEEIDLAIQTRFPGNLEEPFFISADVGQDAQDFILGLWDRKVEPCDSSRLGCQLFGFLLDGPLASWPPDFYEHLQWQRIPPSEMALRPVNGGRPPSEVDALAIQARQQFTTLLAPFDVQVHLLPQVLAEQPVQGSAVYFHDPRDVPMSRMLAAALSPQQPEDKEAWSCCQPVDDSPADTLDLLVEGDPALHACLQQHCAQAADLSACHDAHCP